MSADGPCEFLPWDSELFGRRIARVRGHRLDRERSRAVVGWSRDNAIDCLYFLASCNDQATVRWAERSGFELVDVRLTLERPLADHSVSQRSRRAVRPCREEDLEALRPIARSNHRDSRFYCDGRFPEHLCDSLYERWLENSLHGFADALWIIDHQGTPAGYLAAHLRARSIGQIGLLGVARACRGQGLGARLRGATLEWFAENEIRKVRVVTQGRNVRAQRFYQKHGFVTRSLRLWFHRWSDAGDEGAPP